MLLSSTFLSELINLIQGPHGVSLTGILIMPGGVNHSISRAYKIQWHTRFSCQTLLMKDKMASFTKYQSGDDLGELLFKSVVVDFIAVPDTLFNDTTYEQVGHLSLITDINVYKWRSKDMSENSNISTFCDQGGEFF
jgi:hypothetical protein